MSEYITIKEQKIPIVKETDVIVIGGGVAGIAAAVAARRHGARVTLIEKSIVLGGLATLGHVCIYLPIDDGVGHKVYGGLVEELLYTCIKYGYDTLPDAWRDRPESAPVEAGRYQTNFNIPAAILAFDELTENEGVDVVFDTVFSEPIMDGKTVKGIIVENKDGRTAYMAKMFVDASGDADLVFRAGADTESSKTIVSHWFHELDFDIMKRGIEKGSMPLATPLRWLGLAPDENNEGKDDLMCEGATNAGVNKYIKLSRHLALDFLKEHQSKDFCMITLPFMPQFRTTRRLVGKDELRFDGEYHIESSVGCVIASLANPAVVYEFPYEGLITDKLSNVLAAGRMTSARGRGWDIMRNIPACVMTGEASGTAATLAVKNGCTLQDLNVKELQDTLEKAGVKLHRKPECVGNIDLPKPVKKPVERKEGEPNISMTSMVHFESSDTKISGRH